MGRLLILAMGLFLLAGCIPQAERPTAQTDDAAMALQAKAAIVALTRAQPSLFEGLDADTLAATPLQPGDRPHTYFLGAFTINVEKRYYSADIGGLAWHQFYHGTFAVDAAGRWTANEPIATASER
jgi:hypothetical protein